MPGIDSEPIRVAQYGVQIECPKCGEKMILHIGLAGDPKNNLLECTRCHGEIVPLVPGQIVGGPFPASEPVTSQYSGGQSAHTKQQSGISGK